MAVRLLICINSRAHITPIRKSLLLIILAMTFRALHGQAPIYNADLIKPVHSLRSLVYC